MRSRIIALRVDEDIVKRMDYLQQLNGYKNRSDTVRRIINKEYRKEMFAKGYERAKEKHDGKQ